MTTTGPVSTCQSCGGPCLTYKGSEWQWTCGGCIRSHQEAQIARVDARQRQHRERLNLVRGTETQLPVR